MSTIVMLESLAIDLELGTRFFIFDFYSSMWKYCITIKGPQYLDLSFRKNSLSLELYSNTWWLGLKFLTEMCLSCQSLVISL